MNKNYDYYKIKNYSTSEEDNITKKYLDASRFIDAENIRLASRPLPAHFAYLENHIFSSDKKINDMLRIVLAQCPEINQAIMNILKSKNFVKVEEIGSGCTRTASEFRKEDPKTGFEQRVVVKIPHDTVDEDSVTSLINNSKGDMNIKEIKALNEIDHENIVKIIDAFEVNYHDLILNEPGESWRKDVSTEWLSPVNKCSKVVTIESFFESRNLEDVVNEDDPITDSNEFSCVFEYIFEKVLNGLKYLHVTKSMVHRDIKPSNILIGKDNVKITDLQNAAKLEDITAQALPTRGGTAHTDLRILDAFLAGKESCASIKSDLYALGTTMYFFYTGKNMFDFELKVDKASKQAVDIDGQKVGYVFKKDNVPVTSLDLKVLDKEIKKKLKAMPFCYRKLMYNLISPFSKRYNGNAEQAHKQLEYDFVNASTMYYHLKKLAKRVIISAVLIPLTYYAGSAIANTLFPPKKMEVSSDKNSQDAIKLYSEKTPERDK